MKALSILTFTLIFASINASMIKFSASPDVITQNLTSFASMRCSLADTDTGGQTIGRKRDVTQNDVVESDVVTGSAVSNRDVLVTNTTDDILRINSITVRRNNGEEVTFASPFDPPTALVDQGNLEVKGSVTGRDSQGYVELSWRDASLLQLGGYECEIETVDKQHHHRMYTASLELTSAPPSLADVVAYFKQKDQQLTQDNERQKQEIEAQQQEINALKQCSNANVGFTATFKSPASNAISLSRGQTAKFDNSIYNAGGAYDPSTGLFTCSVPGMYSFQINSLAYSDNESTLQLQLNGRPITAAHASGSGHWNSASSSAVLSLKQGDVVKVLVGRDSTVYQNDASDVYQVNVFSGHLIKAAGCFA